MDETTRQIFSLLFLLATAALIYAAGFLLARASRRRPQRPLAAFERLPRWISRAIETRRPLHLAFGSAGIGDDNTAVALAEAEFFHHIIAQANLADAAPIVSLSSAATVPLAQETLRRAWDGDSSLDRVRWQPQGKRSLAYAAALSAMLSTSDDEAPAAHILAGSFGPELALLLDSADRRGQPSLAVSDQLEGQAVAYALADSALIGEELFAAPSYVADDPRLSIDAVLLDIGRGLLILGLTIALLLEIAEKLLWLSWPMVAVGLALLVVVVAVIYRRRRNA